MFTVNHKSVCCVLVLFLGVAAAAEVAEQTCEADGTCQQSSNDSDTNKDSNCVDMHQTCGYWADVGECNINPACTY
jgi:hypothetical protein